MNLKLLSALICLSTFVECRSNFGEIKRYPKFMNFPRVGRTGHKSLKIDHNEGLDLEKRNDEKSGVWFGPRLGRTLEDRKNVEVQSGNNLPWAYIIFNENTLERMMKSIEESSSTNNNNDDIFVENDNNIVDTA